MSETKFSHDDPQAPGRPERDDAREILRDLRRILRTVDLQGRQVAQRHGLSGPQLICLREIHRHGPLNPGQLARRVSLSPATISGILDRLEGRALLTRRRRHRDKRQVLVELTGHGEALLEETGPPLQERFVARLDELDASERARIAAALERVVALMDAEDLEAAPLLVTGAATATHPSQGVRPKAAGDPGLESAGS